MGPAGKDPNMSKGDEPDAVDAADATAVFRGLADPTRVSILVSLAEHHREGGGPLGFSELRRMAEVSDSGRFNYHLNELVPRFVTQTDEGYRLRYAGRQAYALIAAGTGTDDAVELSAETDHTCLLCPEPLTAEYEHDRLQLRCPNHDVVAGIPLPPSVVADRSLEDLLGAVDAAARSQFEFSRSLVCPECWGPMTTTLDPPDGPGASDADSQMHNLQYRCTHCAHAVTFPVRYLLTDHPAVVAFHHAHGTDLTRVNMLDIDEQLAIADSTETDAGVRLAFELDGDVLVVEVDGTGTVVATDRPTDLPAW